MGETTKIQWTESTWTPIRARNIANGTVGWYCEHVSDGCRRCYSESMNHRLGTQVDFKPGNRDKVEMFLDEGILAQPLRLSRGRMIFVCSMTDLFAEFVPNEWIDKIFAVMALTPHHTYQVLTKRPERMQAYMSDWFGRLSRVNPRIPHPAGEELFSKLVDWSILPDILPNVWAGTSCEDQKNYDERIKPLSRTKAKVRFLSVEPILGPVDIEKGGVPDVDWVIIGGESGRQSRTCNALWVRDLRDQCKKNWISVFIKQLGSRPFGLSLPLHDAKGGNMDEWPEDLRIREIPQCVSSR